MRASAQGGAADVDRALLRRAARLIEERVYAISTVVALVAGNTVVE